MIKKIKSKEYALGVERMDKEVGAGNKEQGNRFREV